MKNTSILNILALLLFKTSNAFTQSHSTSHSPKDQKIGFQDQLLLIAGQKDCRMLQAYFANILLLMDCLIISMHECKIDDFDAETFPVIVPVNLTLLKK